MLKIFIYNQRGWIQLRSVKYTNYSTNIQQNFESFMDLSTEETGELFDDNNRIKKFRHTFPVRKDYLCQFLSKGNNNSEPNKDSYV